MPEVAVQFRVEKTLSFVPEGCVISYALLADLCGLPGRARMMGKCLVSDHFRPSFPCGATP